MSYLITSIAGCHKNYFSTHPLLHILIFGQLLWLWILRKGKTTTFVSSNSTASTSSMRNHTTDLTQWGINWTHMQEKQERLWGISSTKLQPNIEVLGFWNKLKPDNLIKTESTQSVSSTFFTLQKKPQPSFELFEMHLTYTDHTQFHLCYFMNYEG